MKMGALKKSSKETSFFFFFCCGIIYFCKLLQSTLSQSRDEGFKVVGLRPSCCRSFVAWNTCIKLNVTNKRTNWPLQSLDTVDTWTPISRFFLHPERLRGRHGRQDWGEGVFMLESFGQLSLIWDLQVTLCPHGCLLTGARFMEWDSGVFSLWLAGLRPAMHKVL